MRCRPLLRPNVRPRVVAAIVAGGVVACQLRRQAPAPVRHAEPGEVAVQSEAGDRVVRVALAAGVRTGRVSATGEWRLYHDGGSATLVRGTGHGTWTVERWGRRLRVVSSAGTSATRDGPLIARSLDPRAFVTWNGKRYRGELVISPTAGDDGLLVLNRVTLEDYLRGVVPLEIGDVTTAEEAALEAQAVAARSYTAVRLDDPDAPARPYDVVATTTDQVYGGVDGETRLGDEAVAATTGQVITYAGRVVSAPYHSACGGSTAEAAEVWHTPGEPYLQRVSDRIPGTDHYYCEHSASFRWTRTFTRRDLAAAIDRYLPRYASVPKDHVGRVRMVVADLPTPSGRVAGITIVTDRGRYHVRGNDARFVFRNTQGDILNSTSFFIESVVGADGRLASLTLRGAGNGHGVWMCQWGAIGRARAGQDYRTILATYYPGTVVRQTPAQAQASDTAVTRFARGVPR